MADCILRDIAVEILRPYKIDPFKIGFIDDEITGFNDGIDTAISCISTEVPAADVQPVVTCGKCKYGKYTGTEWFCDKHSGHVDKFGEDASYHEYHSKHWFCADGEARA